MGEYSWKITIWGAFRLGLDMGSWVEVVVNDVRAGQDLFYQSTRLLAAERLRPQQQQT